MGSCEVQLVLCMYTSLTHIKVTIINRFPFFYNFGQFTGRKGEVEGGRKGEKGRGKEGVYELMV